MLYSQYRCWIGAALVDVRDAPIAAEFCVAAEYRGVPKAAVAHRLRYNRRSRLQTASPACRKNVNLFQLAFLNGCCGLADHIDNDLGLGKHRHMAARHLGYSRSHALRNPALEIWMHGVVLRG
jgi:hypothetical protein